MLNRPPYIPSRLGPVADQPGAADPQPPFQVRGVEMVYLEGRMDPQLVRHLLPDWLAPAPSGAMDMAVFTAPEGWGLAPFTSCYIRVALADYPAPDGGSATFCLSETLSARAASVWARCYGGNCEAAESTLRIVPDRIVAEGAVNMGGSLSIQGRRTHGPITALAGAYPEVTPRGDGFVEYTTAYSSLMEPLELESFRLTLPRGHRLEGVRDHFEPVKVAFLHEKSFATGVPRPLMVGRRGATDAAPALIDLIGRLNLPALVFLMDGHLAHVSAAAQRLGPGLDSVVRLVRKRGFLRTDAATFRDQSLPLTLQDGQADVIRLIPLAPMLWGQHAVLCLLADLGRLAATDPVPVLGLVGLTPAEARMTGHLARGASAPEVAALLGLSPHTVRSALKGIYGKLGISSRAELAVVVERLIGRV